MMSAPCSTRPRRLNNSKALCCCANRCGTRRSGKTKTSPATAVRTRKPAAASTRTLRPKTSSSNKSTSHSRLVRNKNPSSRGRGQDWTALRPASTKFKGLSASTFRTKNRSSRPRVPSNSSKCSVEMTRSRRRLQRRTCTCRVAAGAATTTADTKSSNCDLQQAGKSEVHYK